VCARAAIADTALLDQLESIRAADNVPAVGIAIVEEGVTQIASAWGETGNVNHPRADADTFFRVGSITKTFAALALLDLVGNGSVSLDTPLDDIVSDVVLNPYRDAHPVRIVHLLEMTAGLADLSRAGFDHSDDEPIALRNAIELERPSLVAHWPPGTIHSYTNAAAGLTSLVIERVSSESFDDFLADHVLEPMGMPQASTLRTATVASRLALGYDRSGHDALPYWHMLFRAFGGLNATVADMTHFLEHLIARVRKAPRMLRAETPLAATVGLTFGYGLGLYASVRHGHVFYGHGGDADGYRSRYGLLPTYRRGYFVIINADRPDTLERMRTAIEAHLVSDLAPPQPPNVARLAAADLERLTGEYYPAATRFRVADWRAGTLPTAHVTRSGQGLTFRAGRRTATLIPVTAALFRRATDPVATVAFVADGGDLHLQGELGAWVRIP